MKATVRAACARGAGRPHAAAARWVVTAAFLAFLPALTPTPGHAALQDCEGDLTPGNEANPIVELQTNLGSICVELFEDTAPIAAANFLDNLNTGFIDTSFFQSSVATELSGYPIDLLFLGTVRIQNDVFVAASLAGTLTNEPCSPDEPVVPGEPGGDLQCSTRGNDRGTLSMTKPPQQQDNRRDLWIVNRSDNRPALDPMGFTAFGKILGDGMDIVDAVAGFEHFPEDELAYSMVSSPFSVMGALQTMPVAAIPVEGDYGCFDVTLLTDLRHDCEVAPVTGCWQFDPDATWAQGETPLMQVLSGACGTQLPNREAYEETPSTSETCTDPDRFGWEALDYAFSVPNVLPSDGDGNYNCTFNAQGLPTSCSFENVYQFTCEEVEESRTGLNARRADLGAKLANLVVKIESATVVPEPSAAALGLASALTLLGLKRRRA